MTADTLQDTNTTSRPCPEKAGVVVVFSGDRPVCQPFALEGRPLVLGRESREGASIDDARMSRHHAEVAIGPTGWLVRDLGSRNGTRVNGRIASSTVACDTPPVLRLGRTVAVAVHDVLPFFAAPPMRSEDIVLGPKSRATFAEIAAVAASGGDLLLTGESGSGKELGAAHFHASGPHARGPFVAVNCAAIPHGIAERLLLGAVRGAYSGASSDAQGYVRAAEGGVLFLDEFGELELEVQAKFLRVIETKEILPVGASRIRVADTSFCLATNRDLRTALANGKMRSDLYYRVTRNAIVLAPLRERREEIPWLAQMAVESSAPELKIEADLVEACMLRPWPGNVRELLSEVRRAALAGRAQSCRTIRSDLLGPHAGDTAGPPPKALRGPLTATQIERALREAPNVTTAAQQLGIHRTHLYRLIRQHGIERRRSSSSEH
jgi:DNA-binding NtrC family response regulator